MIYYLVIFPSLQQIGDPELNCSQFNIEIATNIGTVSLILPIRLLCNCSWMLIIIGQIFSLIHIIKLAVRQIKLGYFVTWPKPLVTHNFKTNFQSKRRCIILEAFNYSIIPWKYEKYQYFPLSVSVSRTSTKEKNSMKNWFFNQTLSSITLSNCSAKV